MILNLAIVSIWFGGSMAAKTDANQGALSGLP
jgi:hypothetical protein